MSTTRFFEDSRSFFSELIEKIHSAQNFIILEYYIFDPDSEIGQKILLALEAADQRGVQVMIRLDGVGSRKWLLRSEVPLSLKNGQVSVFNPVPWPFSFFLRAEGASMNHFLKYWSRINHRNHKKLCIVDGHYAFVGSMNIHAATFDWIECGVMCEREVVYVLLDSFFQLEKTCFILHQGRLKPELFHTVLKIGAASEAEDVLNQTNRGDRGQFRRLHKQAFQKAQDTITLVTPYFVPTFWLMKSLIQACRRGVKVNLVLSGRLDHRFMNWLADKYLFPLIDSGVMVYRVEKMVHAKVVMADSWVHLGSCNLNQRSLHLDRELNVQVRGEEKQNQVRRFVEGLIENSNGVTLETLNQRPWFEKLMGTLLYIVRAIL